MTVDERVLRGLAAKSPQSYADQIAERFEWALGILDQIEVQVKGGSLINRDYENSMGCPHCKGHNGRYDCPKCLWTQLTPENIVMAKCRGAGGDNGEGGPLHWACCRVKFNGVRHGQVCSLTSKKKIVRHGQVCSLTSKKKIVLQLSYNEIVIRTTRFAVGSSTEISEQLKVLAEIREFAQGHVDWTTKYEWGTEIPEKPEEEG